MLIMSISRWLHLFLCVSWLLIPAAAAGGVIAQEVTVSLDPSRHRIVGESSITVRHPGRHLAFVLDPHASIDAITADVGDLPFSFSRGTANVTLPDKRKELTFKVSYRITYNDPLPSRFASTEDPSYGVSGAITEKGAFISGHARWFPTFPRLPDELIITVVSPPDWEAVTEGKNLKREKTGQMSRSLWAIAQALDGVPLSAGPYMPQFKKAGDIDTATYFTAANQHFSDLYLGKVGQYLDHYQRLIGPYPFPKFAVVENFFPTGYGFSSYTLLGSEIIKLPFIPTTSLPHEIAHSWWGNSVYVDYATGNWCEGLVTYMADYLAEEEKSPEAARDYRFRILSDYAALVAQGGEIPLRKFTSRVDPATRAVGYGKGAMVFHMLRRKVGDAVFYQALSDLHRDRVFSVVSWKDFARYFGKASGEDFSPFMAQWVDLPGGPQIAIDKVALKKDAEGGWNVTGVVVQQIPLFAFDIVVRLVAGGEESDQKIQINGKETPFSFNTLQRPERVVADPDIDIFRLLSPAEVPPSINGIKVGASLVMVVAEGCRADRGTLEHFLQALGHDKRAIVAEGKIQGEELRQKDLIFCGVPSSPALTLPNVIAAGPMRFSVGGEEFASPENSLFAVIPHPFRADRKAALFLPLSPGAAEASIAKIPHYGRYGYVVFQAGSNVVKGALPAAEDRTVVRISP